MVSLTNLLKLILTILTGFSLLASPFFSFAAIQDEITTRRRQIEELTRQIQEYEESIQKKQGESKNLGNEIAIINAKINQIQSEIRSLSLSIDQTGAEIQQTTVQIEDAEYRIRKHRLALGSYLRILDQTEQEYLWQILLKNKNFSDFFDNLNNVQTTQENVNITVNQIKETKIDLEEKEDQLREQKQELEDLKRLQQLQKKSVEQIKFGKNELLKTTRGEEARYQNLVKQSKADIEKIRAQITYLQQNGVSAEEAIKYGQLAAIGAGIRPAFLLAILEIESGLGRNVGAGNWIDDMYKCYLKLKKPERAELEKNAFLAIVGKLGLNPNTVKVSREPNYGCGGAMGPAQFLPTTWLGYEEQVARITGHYPPNPWNVEDAFTAAAIKLSRGGAAVKTRTGEISAAKAYISGNAKCVSRICNYYSSAVSRKADQIEQNL